MRPTVIVTKEDGSRELVALDRQGFTKRPRAARVAQRRAKNKIAKQARKVNR